MQSRSARTRNPGADRAADPLRGFTLMEVLVGLVIVVSLSAVITPSLVSGLDSVRVGRGATSLESFATAIMEFEDDVNEYPSALTQLAQPLSTNQENSCRRDYSNGDVGKWEGPYLSRLVPPTGVPIAVGTLQNAIGRTEGQGSSATLHLTIRGVTPEDAAELNRRIDGDADAGANTVRWGAPDASGLVVVEYVTPVKGC